MKITELIGKTPILRLSKTERRYSLGASIYAKLESFNPGHSVKDRAALYMVKEGVRHGLIREGGTVIEPTSGNMGISLSMLSAVFGYRAVIVMPENMSVERRKMILAYGGKVILTEAERGMKGAIEKAEDLAQEIEGAFVPSQFDNPQNSLAHYETTGPEIYEKLGERIDVLVAGVGTGGTLSGVGRYLKERNPFVKIVAVEPSESAVLSGGKSGAHSIQGIGAGFLPPLLDISLVDEVVTVSSAEASDMARELSKSEGIFAGISSGAALSAAVSLAGREENLGKTVVTLLPDGGEKYLSVYK